MRLFWEPRLERSYTLFRDKVRRHTLLLLLSARFVQGEYWDHGVVLS